MNPTILNLNILTETDRTSRILAYRVQNPVAQPVLAGLFVFLKRDFTLLALQDLHLQPTETTSGLLSLPLTDLDAGDLDIRLLVRSVADTVEGAFVDVLPVARLGQQGQTVTFQAVPEAGTRGVLVAREDSEVLGVRDALDDAAWTGQLRLKRASKRAHVTAYVDTARPATSNPDPDPVPVADSYWINPRGVSRVSTGLHTDLSAAQLSDLRVQPTFDSLGVLNWYVPYEATDVEYGPLETPEYTQSAFLVADNYGMVRHGTRSLQYFPARGTLGLLDVTTGQLAQAFPAPLRLGTSTFLPGVGALDRNWAVSIALGEYTGQQRFVDAFDLNNPARSFWTPLPFPEGSQMMQPDGPSIYLKPQVLMDHTNNFMWVMDLQPERDEYLLWQVLLDDAQLGAVRTVPLTQTRHPVFDETAYRLNPDWQARAFTGREAFLEVSGGHPSLLRVSHELSRTPTVKVSRHWFGANGPETELMVLRSPVEFVEPKGVTIDATGTVYVTFGDDVHAVPFAPGDVTLDGTTTVGTFQMGTSGSTHTAIALTDGALVCRASEVKLVQRGEAPRPFVLFGASQLELLMVDHTGNILVREQPGVAT